MSQNVTFEPLGPADSAFLAPSRPPISAVPLETPQSATLCSTSTSRHVVVEPLPAGPTTPRLFAEGGVPGAGTPAAPGGTAAPGTEPEDWISKLVEYLWPKICRATEDIAWDTVPPILDETRPSWV